MKWYMLINNNKYNIMNLAHCKYFYLSFISEPFEGYEPSSALVNLLKILLWRDLLN